MSRGPGRVERGVLVALEGAGAWLTVEELSEALWGRRALSPQSRARRESVRRVLLALERRGLAELGYVKAEATAGEIRRHLAARPANADQDEQREGAQ